MEYTPVIISEDKNKYGYGYDIWQINEDGTLEKIKDYGESFEEGMALYFWEDDTEETVEETATNVIIKYPNKDRDSFDNNFFKKLKNRAGFKEDIKGIIEDVRYCGSHGELVGGKWIVFGEYLDDYYSKGY